MLERNMWEWKYIPKSFEDLILNDNIKSQMKKALDERPNMFLFGSPGVGKGSFVNVLKNVHGLKDHSMTINCSQDGNIETIRGKVTDFISTYSSKLKLVYLNEIDAPQFSMAQKALRQIIEDTQKHTQWILSCNYDQSVIPELKSRCENYHLSSPPATEIYNKCVFILKNEGIKYNPKTLINLVKRTYPDIRNTLITLRQNVVNDKLQDVIEFSKHDSLYKEILDSMKKKDPELVRKHLRSNTIHYPSLFNYLYETVMESEDDVFSDEAEAIILIGEHLHRDNLSSIKEINFMLMYFKMLKNGVI